MVGHPCALEEYSNIVDRRLRVVLLLHRWPGGGGGPLATFLRVIVFCSFTSNLPDWRHVRGVGGWVKGGSRAQMCLRKKNQ